MPSVIPKKIHYIWVGGNIPKGYLENIKHMAALAKRSGFEINLWVDKPKNFQVTSDRFDLDIPNLRIRRIGELSDKMLQDPFYDESKRRQFHECCDMERIGLKNLAAAADLLRYEILREEGGYYIDADTVIDATGAPLFLEGQYLQEDTTEHGFIFGGESQCYSPYFKGGNDLIACCPNHPIIEQTIISCLDCYRRAEILTRPYQLFLDSEEKPNDSYKFNLMDKKRRHQTEYITTKLSMFNSADRKHLTIRMSGPFALILQIENYCRKYNMISKDNLGRLDELTFNMEYGNNNLTLKKVAGIFLVSHSDMNWLQNRQRLNAFDDDEMIRFVHSNSCDPLQQYWTLN